MRIPTAYISPPSFPRFFTLFHHHFYYHLHRHSALEFPSGLAIIAAIKIMSGTKRGGLPAANSFTALHKKVKKPQSFHDKAPACSISQRKRTLEAAESDVEVLDEPLHPKKVSPSQRLC